MIDRFVTLSRRHLSESGVRGVIDIGKIGVNFLSNELEFYLGHKQCATNVFDEEWDLLILLDCATPRMVQEVETEYPFLGEVGSLTSIGTCSNEWMRRTFTSKYRDAMGDTLHVTANTSSERHLDGEQFLHLEEVWRDGWSKELGTIPAPTVTDRAIALRRANDARRTIVHYMQPHLPFVPNDINSNSVTREGIQDEGLGLKELHEEAGYSREELWDASIENLRYVLDSVETLLSNFEAERVVISSDHGQAFGEDGIWSHPCHTYVDQLTQVPWCVTSATDTQSYHPDHRETTDDEDDMTLDEKLSALGYK